MFFAARNNTKGNASRRQRAGRVVRPPGGSDPAPCLPCGRRSTVASGARVASRREVTRSPFRHAFTPSANCFFSEILLTTVERSRNVASRQRGSSAEDVWRGPVASPLAPVWPQLCHWSRSCRHPSRSVVADHAHVSSFRSPLGPNNFICWPPGGRAAEAGSPCPNRTAGPPGGRQRRLGSCPGSRWTPRRRMPRRRGSRAPALARHPVEHVRSAPAFDGGRWLTAARRDACAGPGNLKGTSPLPG